MSENLWFSDVLREYRNVTAIGLKWVKASKGFSQLTLRFFLGEMY